VCPLVQAQWAVLEGMLAANLTRAIGVSNYCQRCFHCINQTATVQPMLNQIQYHAGKDLDRPSFIPVLALLSSI
jgi:diketogulonate reductase-like aldo/keto reductase